MATKKVNPKSKTLPHKTTAPPKTTLTQSITETATKGSSKRHSQVTREVESEGNEKTKITKIRRDARITTNLKNTVVSKTTTTTAVINKNDSMPKRTAMVTGGRAGKVKQPLLGNKSTNVSNNTANKPIKNNNNLTSSNYNKPTTATKPKGNAVLDTYHNVTVASPLQKRRDISNTKMPDEPLTVVAHQQRNRTLTKTLEPEEVLVLKRDSAKQRIEAEIQSEVKLPEAEPIKSPIAFEVNFSEPNSKIDITSSLAEEEDLDNYQDDFESYETDFESDESSSSATEKRTNSSNSSSTSKLSEASETHSPIVGFKTTNDTESEEDDSELTQNPITVIHREKEMERKLDSGHYDLNVRKHPKSLDRSIPTTQYPYNDALSMVNLEQLDSGVSYGTSAQIEPFKNEQNNTCYGGYVGFHFQPVLSKRGLELMGKIQLDKLTYKLLVIKPLNYDVYMQSYGKLNTTQTSTQTLVRSIAAECQTDEVPSCCIWTQHPPRYDLQSVQQIGSNNGTLLNCCGEEQNDNLIDVFHEDNNICEISLQQLKKLRQAKNQRTLQQQAQHHAKPTNFDRFNSFLQHSSLLISRVISLKGNRSNSDGVQLAQPLTPLVTNENNKNRGYNQLDAGFLNALRVRRIFGNAHHQLIITVHECQPDNDVYRSDFANLLMIWSTTELKKPLRLLSTWSEVCHAEFCTNCTDIVVCGLRDGSIAMWDLRETYSFCSMLDGCLKHFAATQSVVPSLNGFDSQKLFDLGSVVDIRSFRVIPKLPCTSNYLNNYKSMQFASLNDTGIIAIWTLVETTTKPAENLRHFKKQATISNSRFEHSSPWSRVKLIQSAICDLRQYLEQRLVMCQSQYAHTKSHFQNNIYSDGLLRELKENQSPTTSLQGLRFTSIDTGCENIYVCTNRNFILNCTKSLNPERFRHIAINDSRFLFPTALCVLSNENYLAVGLSNGSVLILNCYPQKMFSHKNKITKQELSENKSIRQLSNSEVETGKSCAIQNIILSERCSLQSRSINTDNFELTTSIATNNDLIDNRKRLFELQVFDQQLLMSGSTLRKDLVQSIALSSDGYYLYVLANGALRVYDFNLDKETQFIQSDIQPIRDIAVSRTSHNMDHLVILNQENNVNLYVRSPKS